VAGKDAGSEEAGYAPPTTIASDEERSDGNRGAAEAARVEMRDMWRQTRRSEALRSGEMIAVDIYDIEMAAICWATLFAIAGVEFGDRQPSTLPSSMNLRVASKKTTSEAR